MLSKESDLLEVGILHKPLPPESFETSQDGHGLLVDFSLSVTADASVRGYYFLAKT